MGERSDVPLEVRLEAEDFATDRLQISRLSGSESISELFRFEVEVACLDPDGLDLQKVIGHFAALSFLVDGNEVRRVHGIISEGTDRLDSETAFASYRLVLVPRAFQLTLVQTQEVYIDLSIVDIISAKAKNIGIHDDLVFRLTGEYPVREFVVQFGETDLAFVSRLTEHLGVSFFFEQIDGRDRLIFTDHKDGFLRTDGAESAAFRRRGEQGGIYRLDATQKIFPTVHAVCDYDYEKPGVDLTSTSTIEDGFGGGVVEWGTHFTEPRDGLRLAQVRTEERLVDALSFRGESSVCTLTAGSRVFVDDHPRLGRPELLVIEVTHELTQSALGSGVATPRYTNTFRAVFASGTYRPPRRTPRPRIHGIMSGIVDTAPGVEVEHAWLDAKGRYTIRILFDTATQGEKRASLPIRMAQAHSGPNYGIHHPLRPGTEVLLAFVGGDPDRPIIVGSVPNGVTPTPVVDAEHTLHRVRTWSGVLVEIDDGA
jgi:type VI secretion system secreted protein VgrG